MKFPKNAIILFMISLFSIRCGKDNKYWDSDFVVHNLLPQNIEVYSSAYTSTQTNGQQLNSFNDDVAAGSRFVLRNIDAREDPTISKIFHEIKIYKNGIQSPLNALENARWVKSRINDKKFEYTLKVDSTYFP